MAGHGLLDVFYRDLIPGMSTEDIVAQRRMTWPGSWAAAERWRIAVSADGRTLGGLNAFPHDVLSNAQPDPLMGPERRDAAAALGRLEEEQTPGSFYINMIAVFPERRSGGVGSVLMAEAERLARAAGFGRMTLSTFAADHKLVSFYRRHGFRDRRNRADRPASVARTWRRLGRHGAGPATLTRSRRGYQSRFPATISGP